MHTIYAVVSSGDTLCEDTIDHAYGSVSCVVPQHLRWMMQKYQLKQDLFLVSPCCPHQACFCSPRIRLLIPAVLVMSQIGPPGPERRRLAMRFAEVLQLEVEYLAITRDTTGRARPQ